MKLNYHLLLLLLSVKLGSENGFVRTECFLRVAWNIKKGAQRS